MQCFKRSYHDTTQSNLGRQVKFGGKGLTKLSMEYVFLTDLINLFNIL